MGTKTEGDIASLCSRLAPGDSRPGPLASHSNSLTVECWSLGLRRAWKGPLVGCTLLEIQLFLCWLLLFLKVHNSSNIAICFNFGDGTALRDVEEPPAAGLMLTGPE